MRVVLTEKNQPGMRPFDCQKLMREVQAFQRKAHEGWEGGPLQILVTGRSAYVAEISLSMRHDIVITLLGSILLVSGVFYAGFRRWLPLLGMGISLLLCCLVALAAGLLIFGELNMVTVGFCAILIGLGVDFAILVFGRYQQARDDGEEHPAAIGDAIKGLGQAIFFGALTTAVGFLALMLAGSRGFTQLGVLIALGIAFAGIFMLTVFFLFLPRKSPAPGHDWMFTLVKRYVRWAVLHPARMLWISTPLLLLLTAVAFAPRPRLIFDISTHSMEPKRSDAGYALKTIMEKMPTRWEPVIGMIKAENAQQLHDYWQKVEPRWSALPAAGKIKGFSTPAALALSPRRLEANRGKLGGGYFSAGSQQSLQAAAGVRDYPANFSSGLNILDELKAAANRATRLPDWREVLPQTSGWWFLIDRYFAHDPLLTTGFVTTNEPIETQEQKEMLRRELPVPAVPMVLSGWS